MRVERSVYGPEQLDRDDNNAQATGRIGSVCPEHTVKGTNDYAAKVVGAREYAAVIGSNLSVHRPLRASRSRVGAAVG